MTPKARQALQWFASPPPAMLGLRYGTAPAVPVVRHLLRSGLIEITTTGGYQLTDAGRKALDDAS